MQFSFGNGLAECDEFGPVRGQFRLGDFQFGRSLVKLFPVGCLFGLAACLLFGQRFLVGGRLSLSLDRGLAECDEFGSVGSQFCLGSFQRGGELFELFGAGEQFGVRLLLLFQDLFVVPLVPGLWGVFLLAPLLVGPCRLPLLESQFLLLQQFRALLKRLLQLPVGVAEASDFVQFTRPLIQPLAVLLCDRRLSCRQFPLDRLDRGALLLQFHLALLAVGCNRGLQFPQRLLVLIELRAVFDKLGQAAFEQFRAAGQLSTPRFDIREMRVQFIMTLAEILFLQFALLFPASPFAFDLSRHFLDHLHAVRRRRGWNSQCRSVDGQRAGLVPPAKSLAENRRIPGPGSASRRDAAT